MKWPAPHMLLLLSCWSCLTLCNPMDCSMPGFPVLYHLPEFVQTHAHWVGYATNHLIHCCPLSSFLQSFPASGSFLTTRLFISGGKSIGASALATFLPMYIEDWFPLGLTDLISLQSKELSRVFSSTTVGNYLLSSFCTISFPSLSWSFPLTYTYTNQKSLPSSR